MAEPITMQKLTDASFDADTLGEFANQDKLVTSRLGAKYPSAPMASRLVVENGLLGATPFSTYAAMTASALVDGDYAVVTNDADLGKNGVYHKTSGVWEYIKYNPLAQLQSTAREIENNIKDSTVQKEFSYGDDLLYAVVDAQGNKTWLQVNATDGGLTPDAADAVKSGIGMENGDSGDFFAVVDNEGNATDLRLDSRGLIHDDVIKSWGERLSINTKDIDTAPNFNHLLPVNTSATTSLSSSDVVFINGEMRTFYPDNNKVMYQGSSSADLASDEFLRIINELNPSASVYDISFGGTVIEDMMPVVGTKPMKLTFNDKTITASGQTKIDRIILSGRQPKPNYIDSGLEGWIEGVFGTFKKDAINGYVFERDTAAPSDTQLTTDTVEFIPHKGYEYRNGVQVIWIGKNNLMGNYPSDDCVGSLLKNTNDMINFTGGQIKRTIVMTHFVNKFEPIDSDKRARINLCNHLYKLYYKQNCFDVEPLLLGTQIFTDLGITRTIEDAEQQALGNVPPSLHRDTVHLATSVNTYIMNKLKLFIQSKGWF